MQRQVINHSISVIVCFGRFFYHQCQIFGCIGHSSQCGLVKGQIGHIGLNGYLRYSIRVRQAGHSARGDGHFRFGDVFFSGFDINGHFLTRGGYGITISLTIISFAISAVYCGSNGVADWIGNCCLQALKFFDGVIAIGFAFSAGIIRIQVSGAIQIGAHFTASDKATSIVCNNSLVFTTASECSAGNGEGVEEVFGISLS